MSDQASTHKAFNRLVKERADLETQERERMGVDSQFLKLSVECI